MVIGISVGTSNTNSNTMWGLRDIRLLFKRCDDNCEVCTENGCEKCKGFLQLRDMECRGCLVGMGMNVSNNNSNINNNNDPNNNNNGSCVACP